MKILYSMRNIAILMLLFVSPVVTTAQIFEPEGINMPGTWNNFTNPPAEGSVFGSSTQVNGQVTPITLGQRRWQTTIHIASSNADTSAGTYDWLFTSGPEGNAFANKWAGVNVVMNTLQEYSFNDGEDNEITVENNKYYTVNWEDLGYQNSRAIFMETSSMPANFLNLSFQPESPSSSETVLVTINVENAPSAEELFYVRYSTDGFENSSLIPLNINGTELSGEIPAQLNGSEVQFYAFSTTVENPINDFDLVTLNFINNLGENFIFIVEDETISVDLGADINLCEEGQIAPLDAGSSFETYLWSTGDTTSSIVVDAPGQYTVEVSFGGLIARDTLIVRLSDIPGISLGEDINQCSSEPITISSGITIGSESGLITITYDASQGQTGLVGASTVYMHSSYELEPFGGPVLPFIGNWGEDDGLGEMTNVGEDLWEITINLFEFYNIPEEITEISGLILVFRNADGSEEGKDENGNDIFINLQGETPISAFTGVTAENILGGYESITWNTGDTTASIVVTQSGTYSATVITTDGCEFTDEIQVSFGDLIAVDLPEEITTCEPTLTLDAGEGYLDYSWSTGETTQTIEVTESGVYTVTVSNDDFCSSTDSTVVSFTSISEFSLGEDISICGSEPITLSTGLSISAAGDSVTIRYDATQGDSQLEGAAKVYMHSGLALEPQGPWNNVVGNWGQDDGIGEMQQDPNNANAWTITLNPFSYYGINEEQDFSGIWIVFRNEDGTLTGKNEQGQDIYLNASAYPSLTASFGGLTASVQPGINASLIWSTNETTSSIEVTESGIYWAEIGEGECAFRDSIEVTFIELPELGLSPDTSFCGSIQPFTISVNEGFESYLWSTNETESSIEITASGIYTITATLGECSIVDSVIVQNNINPGAIDLGPDRPICGNGDLELFPGIFVSPVGDSLTIVYDATQGQSGLAGASTVYMHSSFEYMPFGGPQEPWVGNWGQDDGLGQMENIGEDLWSITINVYDYYSINPDSLVNGLFMVFRNADGTAEGKDENGDNIFLNLLSDPPSSAFGGVTASVQSSGYVGLEWSTGEISSSIFVTEPGEYFVTVFGQNGCNASDTIQVGSAPLPTVDLGSNQVLCDGESTILDAGAGFSSYLWSNGATTQTISTSLGGSFAVTVTNAEGCEGFDSVGISENQTPQASFSWIETVGLTIDFTYIGSGTGQFFWDFDSDGTVDNTTANTTSFTYPEIGQYEATLVVSNLCGADTTSVQLDLIGLGESIVNNSNIELFPNPANNIINLKVREDGIIRIINPLGQIVHTENIEDEINSLNISYLTNGIYFLEFNGKSGKELIRFIKN